MAGTEKLCNLNHLLQSIIIDQWVLPFLSSSSDLTMAACAAILSLSLAPLSPPEPISHIDSILQSLLMQEDIYYSWSNEESSKHLYHQQEASFFGIGKCKGTTCCSESEKNWDTCYQEKNSRISCGWLCPKSWPEVKCITRICELHHVDCWRSQLT